MFAMSESDDSDILADIQALDEALALTAKKKSEQCVSSSPQFDVSDIEDLEDNNDYLDYLNKNQSVDESLDAYEINTKLITGLTITKRKLIILLNECEEKINLLDEKLMEFKSGSSLNTKLAISNAGMPYFKNKDYFGAPKNYDSKLKKARGELFLPSLKKPSRWSGKDREMLLSAINNQAIESIFCGEFSKEIESKSDNELKTTKLVLPRNFNEMVGALGEREFDWHKISVMDFDNKHSPGECRAMWNVYLHPDFRKTEWTSAEDNKLLKYAREYKYQDWDAVTRKLGTNRSAYQCFIRYNTIKKVPSAGRPWTKQEDKHLTKIINALSIGDYTPWAEFANHMRHRTKQQIYVRWTYRKAPHLTKGRFTCAETSTLLKAVQKYGKDFCKIASVVMPHRTSIQLQQRYHTVMTNPLNLWTINDDVRLINLHTKYRNDWSKIATFFSEKSRTQVRHRYNALLRYTWKGVSIENIPRPPPSVRNRKFLTNKKSLSNIASKVRNKISRLQPAINIFDIKLRVYETLCFSPSIKLDNSEEFHDIEQLARNTKILYNTLNLLNVNLEIPDDFLNYVQLDNRDKQLLVFLKEHINTLRNGAPNNELIEKFRTRMFGYSEVSESDFFIPPLPFDGYVKTKKIKNQKNTSIDYNLDVNEKFLVDMPSEFSVIPCILPLVDVEEQIQFYKLGQFLTNDYHNHIEQNINLYKSLKCILSFAKEDASDEASEYNELNVNSKINLEEQINQKESIDSNEDNEKTNMSNIILPNQATLLGLKNLLLWKLLYDYQQDESRERCDSLSKNNSLQTINSRPVQTESIEYQLLRTRLLRLFKFPLGLSNTILQMPGPETIFSIKQKPTDVVLTVPKKRKFVDTIPVQVKQEILNNPTNNDSQSTSDIATRKLPARKCKTRKKI